MMCANKFTRPASRLMASFLAFSLLAVMSVSAQAAQSAKVVELNMQGAYSDLYASTKNSRLYDFWRQNTYNCPSGKTVMAKDVQTTQDLQSFVECARSFIVNMGWKAARKAFRSDPQWRSEENEMYLFLDVNTNDGNEATSLIYPPNPSLEGSPWGDLTDANGNDYFTETFAVLENSVAGSGFTYYTWNAAEGAAVGSRARYKVSYVTKVYGGSRGTLIPASGLPITENGYTLGAGLYPRDIMASCDEATAVNLQNTISMWNRGETTRRSVDRALSEFVRCAAIEYQKINNDNAAETKFTTDKRWRSGSVYLFSIDPDDGLGTTLFRTDGSQEHDWMRDWKYDGVNISPTFVLGAANVDGRMQSHNGRDIVSPAMAAGESFIYYRAQNPGRMSPFNPTGRSIIPPRKISFLKRIVVNGKARLLGAGYYQLDGPRDGTWDCQNVPRDRRFVMANAVQTRDDLEAFVYQARCYLANYGFEAARAEFQKPMWSAPERGIQLFVEKPEHGRCWIAPIPVPGADCHIANNELSAIGNARPRGRDFRDAWNNFYYPEAWRILRHFSAGWSYWTSSPTEEFRGQDVLAEKKTGFVTLMASNETGKPDSRTPADEWTKYAIGSSLNEQGLLNYTKRPNFMWPTDSADSSMWSCDMMRPTQPMSVADSEAPMQMRLSMLQSFVRCISYVTATRINSDEDALKTFLNELDLRSGDSSVDVALFVFNSEGEMIWGNGSQWSGQGPHGSNIFKVFDSFGEAFVYHRTTADKVSFVQRVQIGDNTYYVGAGLH